ncbi:MAG: amidohydrolase [Firmicutes bacterium]|nr:amidohydrolase [Bacillota bacterium]
MAKSDLLLILDGMKDKLDASCQQLWDHPEVGGTEDFGPAYLKAMLAEEGFTVTVNDKLPTAFIAEWGTGSPVLAFLGEYDALPGLSQKVSATKEEIVSGGPGHGCGHNLLGSGTAACVIALKKVMEQDGLTGTLRFYGCPEEELLSGKVKMAYHHMFDGCDIAFSWHPSDGNTVYDKAYLASASYRFYFKGLSSHAGLAPQNGRSALDAVEIMNVAVQYLREHVIDGTRIHYTTDSCGYAPNIVHPQANSWYYVRAPFITDVKETAARVIKCAKGAATATETEVEAKLVCGCCEMLTNHAFADLTHKNMLLVPPTEYTQEELAFAAKLQETLNPALLSRQKALYGTDAPLHSGAAPRDFWKSLPVYASSDAGDVSYIMPMNLINTTCWPIGVAPHTWQAAASTGSSIGKKGALWSAKATALTAYDILTMPEELEKIKNEFRQRNDGSYKPMYEG